MMECWRLMTINSIFLLTAVVLLLNSWFLGTRHSQRLHRVKSTKERQNTSRIRFPANMTLLEPGPYDLFSGMDVKDAERIFYQFLTQLEITCETSSFLGWDGDGSWPICLEPTYKPSPPCLAYSFGINYDFGFDDQISSRFDCHVRSFDPSMGDTPEHLRSERVRFYPWGLGARKEVRVESGWTMETYQGLLEQFEEHQNIIDYLKFDIEASEWEVLPDMYDSGLLANVKQIGFELHTHFHSLYNTTSVTTDQLVTAYQVIRELEDLGFRKWYHHTNPFCNLISPHLGEMVSLCHELVYININFLDEDYIQYI